MSSVLEIGGRSLHRGTGVGDLLVLDEPLSFWGGTDRHGAIIDEHHPQHGTLLAGRVVAMRASRGSSSSSSVLAEAIRSRAAPAGILLAEPDGILAVGALVAAELYGKRVPVVVLDDYDALPPGGRTTVSAGPQRATVTFTRQGAGPVR